MVHGLSGRTVSWGCSLLTGVAALLLLSIGLQDSPSDPFRRGQVLLEAGDTEAALNLWLGVRDSLSAAGAEDPRIATAFVGTVAADPLLERYEEVAASVFYWGFSTSGARQEVRNEILAEGLRTFALTDSLEADRWAQIGRDHPAALARAIKQFWIENDPTPSTIANERLIEHWNRLTYARKNFVYNRSSPYETDDRGVFYVKYGEPDRILRGHLGVNGNDRRLMGLPLEYIMLFDRQPQYEIWRYATLDDGDFTYFLFGNTDGTGPFRAVTGLHEIIPRNARTSPRARHRGVRAQYYLELFYYGDLARMGGPYGQRFTRLSNLWTQSRAPRDGTLEAMSQQHINEDRIQAMNPRPPSWSEIGDAPQSALSAQVARVLEGPDPRLLVVAVSSPRWMPTVEGNAVVNGLTLDGYEARHTAVVRDRGLREITRAGMLPVDGQDHMTLTALNHVAEIDHVTVSVRHEIDYRTGEGAVTVYPGRTHFDIAPPLARPEFGFEVSDLLVGLAPRPEFPLEGSPAPLLPATRFWKEDLMRVYFELYRPLSAPPANGATFDVHLRIRSDPDQGGVPDGRGEATVRVSLESRGSTTQHVFDLDLRNEAPGDLQVILEITDPATGVTQTRVTPVHLLRG